MFGWLRRSTAPNLLNFDRADVELYGQAPKPTGDISPFIRDTDALCAKYAQEAKQHFENLRNQAEETVLPGQTVDQRFKNLIEDDQIVRDLVASMGEIERRHALEHEEVIEALKQISTEVRRGATAANLIDFARQHPFLSGMIGTHILHKIASK